MESTSSSLKESAGALEKTVFSLLTAETEGDDASIRFTMALGAVQAIVRELSRKAPDQIDFVEKLRRNRSRIVDITMGILFEGCSREPVHGS